MEHINLLIWNSCPQTGLLVFHFLSYIPFPSSPLCLCCSFLLFLAHWINYLLSAFHKSKPYCLEGLSPTKIAWNNALKEFFFMCVCMSLQCAVWNYVTREIVLLENNIVLDTVAEENLVSRKNIGSYYQAPTTPPVFCLLDPPKHLWHTAVPTVFVSFFSNQKILGRLQKCNYFSHSASLLTTPCAREELFLHQCIDEGIILL